ncbi:hypothetical protein PENSPDRAFT_753624 [Peniophora sp. CONT]|nr:hypothetical protein PENSPDRAFT_753624 [Peniophora sp. CONT]
MADEPIYPTTKASALDAILEQRLPPEILSRVFEMVHDDCSDAGSLGWLTVSHVCTYWRDCALRCQKLWATINSKVLSRGLLDVFLERSGAVPLIVSMDIHQLRSSLLEPTRVAYLKILSTALHRVHTLSHAKKGNSFQQQLATTTTLNLEKFAPMLRVLRLHGIVGRSYLVREVQSLKHFLSNLTPNIQEVELGQLSPTCFPWASPPAHVRTLYLLVHGKLGAPSSLSFSEILDGLRAMPSLEALTLCGVVPTSTSSEATSTRTTVSLSCLHTLRLEGRGEQHVLLWSLLKTPDVCSVRLKVLGLIDSEPLRAAWSQRWAMFDSNKPWEMVVEDGSTSKLSFSVSPYSRDDERSELKSKRLHIDISITWHRPQIGVQRLTEHFFFVTPIPSLKRITLRSHTGQHYEDRFIAALARQATSLETLTLETFMAHELYSLFVVLRHLETPGAAGVSRALVPRLRTLVLKECELDAHHAGPALRDTLVWRAAGANVKLDTITFAGCLSASDSKRIEELKLKLVQSGLIRSFSNII